MKLIDNFWTDKSVLVTGATGLLGSWLVKKLVELQANVVCLVRDWTPNSGLIRSGLIQRTNIVRGDVRRRQVLERILNEFEIRTVFHLAAQTIVTIANRNPAPTFDTNIRGTWSVLESCRQSPTVDGVIVASSDKAYGDQEKLPYDESMPLKAKYPYDVSKACGDLISQCYAATYGMSLAVVRCGNLYGGGDLNWSRIIPGTIRSIIREQRPEIRCDGQLVRDYFYVEDATAAYIFLAEQLAQMSAIRGEVFNFSYETPITVLEIVNLVTRLMGSKLEPVIRNEASHEIHHQHLSTEKARRILGWQPQMTFEEGLIRTIEWYRRFFGSMREDSIQRPSNLGS